MTMTLALPANPSAPLRAACPRPPQEPKREPPPEADALFTMLYDDLLRLARREVYRSGGEDVVSMGTLVHEAWIEISRQRSLHFGEPGRFLAYAARTMRGLAIDRVRARGALKRGGNLSFSALDTLTAEQIAAPQALQEIGDALDELAQVEPELAQVVDLKFFCGFTLAEVAAMQGISERTAQRHWGKARLLLFRALAAD